MRLREVDFQSWKIRVEKIWGEGAILLDKNSESST